MTLKQFCEKYLAEQFGNDADIMNEIYGEYVSSVKEKISDLKNALDASDWQNADRIAHTVKGNALSAGDEEVAVAAIELRKAAALNNMERCRSLLDRIAELSKGL